MDLGTQLICGTEFSPSNHCICLICKIKARTSCRKALPSPWDMVSKCLPHAEARIADSAAEEEGTEED